MSRVVLYLFLAACASGCARSSYVRVRHAGPDRLDVELVVHEGYVYPRFYELVDAILLSQTQRWSRRDCVFFLDTWQGREPIRVWTEKKRELDIKGEDLALIPVCGRHASKLLSSFVFDRGVAFYGEHRISTFPNPPPGRWTEVGDSMEAVFNLAAQLTGTSNPSIVYQATVTMYASDVLRTGAELVRRGANVLILPTEDTSYYFYEALPATRSPAVPLADVR